MRKLYQKFNKIGKILQYPLLSAYYSHQVMLLELRK